MRLASYVATRPGLPGLFNRLVRFVIHAPESHSELVFSDGMSFSCSWLDGGARFKRIEFDAERWQFTEVPARFDEAKARQWAEAIVSAGIRYSVLLLAAQVFPFLLRFVSSDREMCSSAIALALGIPDHRRYEPHELRLLLEAGA